tara:strand:+ start:98 stop:379 length:282 start_codon:yes stop_codon:yes gene_type:complete
MRNKSETKKQNVKLIILYLKYRNSYNAGFQKYQYFKSLMRYITDINDNTFIRRLFDEMMLNGVMERKLIIGSVRYRFNPYHKTDPVPYNINFI